MTARPEHLPDFDSPPLDEVVVGVQFAAPVKYSSIYAKDIRGLFQTDYPNVEERPAIEPTFETFGGLRAGTNLQPAIKLQFASEPVRSRLWFISSDESHLIQFQSDRLLLNWRKRPNGADYPRFESIAESFEGSLGTLQEFYRRTLDTPIEINQSEVSYINTISVDDYASLGHWISFLELRSSNVESINYQLTEVVSSADGRPYARLTHDFQLVASIDGKMKALRLSLTFRGKPAGNSISDAMAFLRTGREMIVTRFAELTTDEAHNVWGRKK